jgi:hypothetical protein
MPGEWKIQGTDGESLFECKTIVEMIRKLSEIKSDIRSNQTPEELLVLFKGAVQDEHTWSLKKEVESKSAKKTKRKKRSVTKSKPAGDRLRLFPSGGLLSPLCLVCVRSLSAFPFLSSPSLPPLSLSLILLSFPACLPARVHPFLIMTATCSLSALFVFIQNSF